MIRKFVNSVFSSNSYLVSEDGLAILIDIGDIEPIIEEINKMNLNLQAVFLTHTHYDHIYGLPNLLKLFSEIPVYTSTFGKDALRNPKWNLSRYHGNCITIESSMITVLADNSDVKVLGNHTLHVMATPGHDKSCLSYTLDRYLFSGDSYIPGIKVSAQFPNSNKVDAYQFYENLKLLSNKFIMCPGHSS